MSRTTTVTIELIDKDPEVGDICYDDVHKFYQWRSDFDLKAFKALEGKVYRISNFKITRYGPKN
jgi:hypothetical protein